MILHDITMTIEPGMAVYKERDEKKPRFSVSRDFNNSSVYESRLDFDLHTGTHVDMPLHMLSDGASSDTWGLETFFTPCLLLEFSRLAGDCITADDLRQKDNETQAETSIIKPGMSVLLKTANSFKEGFDYSFVFLEKSGAAYLAGKNVGGVGIDALGIERDQPGHDTHKTLMNAGAWILEGLRLAAVPQGLYTLAMFPLKISGVEALPVRALLLSPGVIENMPKR
jgi:arylformamidase